MKKSKMHGWQLVLRVSAGVVEGNWNALLNKFPEGSFNFAQKKEA